jgi:hypothetical protein
MFRHVVYRILTSSMVITKCSTSVTSGHMVYCESGEKRIGSWPDWCESRYCGEGCDRIGSWPDWCQSRYFPGDSVDKYAYTENWIAGFGVKI